MTVAEGFSEEGGEGLKRLHGPGGWRKGGGWVWVKLRERGEEGSLINEIGAGE